jgi:hypothetical protein
MNQDIVAGGNDGHIADRGPIDAFAKKKGEMP